MSEVGPDPEYWSRLQQDSAFCFGTGSHAGVTKLGKTGPGKESLFNFGSGRSLCGHFLNKNMGKLRLDP